jgi:hypothetical protein
MKVSSGNEASIYTIFDVWEKVTVGFKKNDAIEWMKKNPDKSVYSDGGKPQIHGDTKQGFFILVRKVE